MKTKLVCILALFAGTVMAKADEIKAPDELPEPVASTIDEYFPGAKPVKVKREGRGEKTEYEVVLDYKDVRLEVEIGADGRLLDVEMED